MGLFDVYPLFPIEPVKASGSWLWDKNGQKYLDLYGGHAVISIGHGHPKYVKALTDQLNRISFYSNSVQNPMQEQLAEKLNEVSAWIEQYRKYWDRKFDSLEMYLDKLQKDKKHADKRKK